jgi:type IV secretion system protein TrbG
MTATRLAALALLAAGPAMAQQVPGIHTAAHSTPGAPANFGQATPGTPVNGTVPGNNGQTPQFDPGRMPPPIPAFDPDKPLHRREARNVGMATRWRQRACTPRRQPDGVLVFQQGACEITVVAAPFGVTDVALEPGEIPTSTPAVGDPRLGLQEPRWSGTGAQQTLHLIFQPSEPNLAGSVNLQTNRRTVHLMVVTRAKSYMPLVKIADANASSESAWSQTAALGRAGMTPGNLVGGGDPCTRTPTIPPSSFAKKHSGWNGPPAWDPVVYGVQIPSGTATCIEFPPDIASLNPPIFIPRDGAGGAPGVDNVRVSGRHYRIDRLVSRFDLVSGSGSDTARVTVTRR